MCVGGAERIPKSHGGGPACGCRLCHLGPVMAVGRRCSESDRLAPDVLLPTVRTVQRQGRFVCGARHRVAGQANLLGTSLRLEVLAQHLGEDGPQGAPQTGLHHQLGLPQYLFRDMLANQVHAHPIGEVVAVVPGGVVRLPREEGLQLVNDEGVQLVLLTQSGAQVHCNPGCSEACLRWRVVVYVPAKVVFLAINHKARVPDSL
mmetsp:Transcript_136903/g.381639  ORF Transcript_136903/g.381639 Transcript_136903/m.381639 type:complete len:204 (+) Transcript_136903:220-831(+)